MDDEIHDSSAELEPRPPLEEDLVALYRRMNELESGGLWKADAEASKYAVVREVQGVPIPFASPQLLWRMKRHTNRQKDAPDLLFLRKLFEANGIAPPDSDSPPFYE